MTSSTKSPKRASSRFRIMVLAAFAVLPVLLGFGFAGAMPVSSLQLSVTLSPGPFSTEQRIQATVILRNVSSGPVVIPKLDLTDLNTYISVQVTHQSGVPIFFIDPIDDSAQARALNTQVLGSGQQLTFTMTLNKLGLGFLGYTDPHDPNSLQFFSGQFNATAQFAVTDANAPTGGDPTVFKGSVPSTAASIAAISFDVCIQDDTSGDLFRFSSTVGVYQFTRCIDQFTLNGTGSARVINSIQLLQDRRADRAVSAGFNMAQFTGTAVVVASTGPGVFQTFRVNQVSTHPTCGCPSKLGLQ
jgi:hypothetical protein